VTPSQGFSANHEYVLRLIRERTRQSGRSLDYECGVHRGSPLRPYCATTQRRLGYFKESKSVRRWSEDFCEWLDKYTFYRSRDEIWNVLRARFARIEPAEVDYLLYRAGRVSAVLRQVLAVVARLPGGRLLLTEFVRKKGGVVLVATKEGPGGAAR
jgi:hypothetical protein